MPNPTPEHFNLRVYDHMLALLAKHRSEHRHVMPQSEIDLGDTDLYRHSNGLEFDATFMALKRCLPGCWHPVNQGTYMISYFPSLDRA